MAENELRDWFNETLYRSLGSQLRALAPEFDEATFLQLTLDGLAERSLMQRMRQTSVALGVTLPGGYRDQVAVLRALAPGLGHSFIGCVLSDFVGVHGLDDPDFSLDSLRFFTCFGSAEFAIREFLARDLDRTLAVMRCWALDSNEHVRRLASEGSRPRLPWGKRLEALVRDPAPVLSLLDTLRLDDSLYVRKSVANHLNDIAKDHPSIVLGMIAEWDLVEPKLKWIATQALRTLVKQGNPDALGLLGFTGGAAVTAELLVHPRQLSLGDRLKIEAQICSTSLDDQVLAVDYVVHYVKASGKTAPKVFKWAQLSLAAGATAVLTKTQVIKDFTTRRHYPGLHRVELQINGQRLAEAAFELSD
jgi:3-methyladenine DNA glycosylase AlkC